MMKPIRLGRLRDSWTAGHNCAVAIDIQRAIDSVFQYGPELVITDSQLPDGDGFDVMRHGRAASPQTPLILMTGYHMPGTEEAARSAGARPICASRLPLRIC